jgi:SOS-response transcriptional repressor LexA
VTANGLSPDARRRLKRLATEFGSQAELARRAGIKPTTLNQILNGTGDVGVSLLDRICATLGVSVDYVLTGSEVKFGGASVIPIMDAQVSAGDGATLTQALETVNLTTFPERWLRQNFGDPSKLHLVQVVGDSMLPTLADGDFVMVDQGKVSGDGIYVVRLYGDSFVKRLNFRGHRIHALSDNPGYEGFTIDRRDKADAEQFDIIGRVVWASKKL